MTTDINQWAADRTARLQNQRRDDLQAYVDSYECCRQHTLQAWERAVEKAFRNGEPGPSEVEPRICPQHQTMANFRYTVNRGMNAAEVEEAA